MVIGMRREMNYLMMGMLGKQYSYHLSTERLL